MLNYIIIIYFIYAYIYIFLSFCNLEIIIFNIIFSLFNNYDGIYIIQLYEI